VVKIAYEQSAGALPFADSHGGGVVVDAHLFGVLGGAGMAACLKPRPEPL
jgi:membrane associated rhomboid family serine protease